MNLGNNIIDELENGLSYWCFSCYIKKYSRYKIISVNDDSILSIITAIVNRTYICK